MNTYEKTQGGAFERETPGKGRSRGEQVPSTGCHLELAEGFPANSNPANTSFAPRRVQRPALASRSTASAECGTMRRNLQLTAMRAPLLDPCTSRQSSPDA